MDLCPPGHPLIFLEFPDVGPQVLILQQFLIELVRTPHVKGSGQQQESSCWQTRHEYAYDAYCQRNSAQDDEYDLLKIQIYDLIICLRS